MLQKPSQLKKGDTIALVSPSAPLAGLLPHKISLGKQVLEELGFKVVIAPNALKITAHTAGTPAERAADLNEMFADSSVKAIMSTIGGFHSNQTLEFLDFDLIRRNPKIFIGYSDISVLHFALHTQADMVTFYGPALISQFAEGFGPLPYTVESFMKILTRPEPAGAINPSAEWTDELLNWFTHEDEQRPRALKPNSGYEWLREGACRGKTLGGCVTSILHLRGTKFWPDFTGRVFFWEIPESSGDMRKGEPASRVDAHLTDLRLSGVFDQCIGMVVGRPRGYSADETAQLKQIILERTAGHTFPILFGADIGHTDPIITLPIGVEVELDSSRNLFALKEAAVTA